jgi:hypothetical protein
VAAFNTQGEGGCLKGTFMTLGSTRSFHISVNVQSLTTMVIVQQGKEGWEALQHTACKWKLWHLKRPQAKPCSELLPILFWTDQWDHSHRDNWMIQELFPWQRQLWAFEGPARGKQLAELLLPYPYVFPQNQQGIKFHFHIFVSHVYREEKFQRSIVILSELKREISAHLGKMWMV